ncbi:hypothetical protein ACFQ0B_11135 [Nonomuraea thailandensis]
MQPPLLLAEDLHLDERRDGVDLVLEEQRAVRDLGLGHRPVAVGAITVEQAEPRPGARFAGAQDADLLVEVLARLGVRTTIFRAFEASSVTVMGPVTSMSSATTTANWGSQVAGSSQATAAWKE